MMASPNSDAHSNLVSPVSPVPLLRAESQPPIPSSVSPSLMLATPPALSVVIPDRESTPTPAQRSGPSGSPGTPPATYPRAVSVFDHFMSPLSESPSSRMSPAPSSVPVTEDISVLTPEPQLSIGHTASGKKRKAKAQSSESRLEGPLSKRARQRANKVPNAMGAGGSGKQVKGKKKIKLFKEEGEPILWPAMTPGEEVPEFVGQFIGCDKCERWYHWTCMGVVPGDSRLEGTFLCPLCVAGNPLPPKGSVDDGAAEQCSRPDCPVQDKFFELEGVYGRYTKLSSTHGRVEYWLVFWKGYKWKDATWEPTRQVDWAVEEFGRRAVVEGFDLDEDSCIILAEAKKGGVVNPEGVVEVDDDASHL
ncbi:hypothetical protein C8R45DRAFT_995329 [Mycena sanguinolenta]|nr:hypothetical protein C8R45DRAFT_995329 [Mycena sanguinolenta]